MLKKYSKEVKHSGIRNLSFAAIAGLTLIGASANATETPTGGAAPIPTLGDDSAYTLTEVESATSGTNVITIPEYNETSQTTEDKYYQLD